MLQWIKRARDLASDYAALPAGEPIAFLLGAGASLSSGAPSTPEVVRRLQQAFPGRFPDEHAVYRHSHQISDGEKRRALAPGFRSSRPYFGYRLLAALARSRPVIVANLNWDNLVNRAAAMASVPCATHEVTDDPGKLRSAIDEVKGQGMGILNLHLHGRLGDPNEPVAGAVRLGTLETTALSETEQAVLRGVFTNLTIVVGTALRSEREEDTPHLLEALKGLPDASTMPLWVFSRQADPADPGALSTPAAAALYARTSPHNFVPGEQVDFDRLIYEIRAAEAEYRFDDLDGHPDVRLPGSGELVFTRPELTRELLDREDAVPNPVLVLAGKPKLGKTTTAHLLAHMLALVQPSPPRVRTFREDQCAEALGSLQPGDVLVLDDPWGQTYYRPNGPTLDALSRAAAGFATVIVSSRIDNWDQALNDASVELASTSADPADWYPRAELLALAERVRRGAAGTLSRAVEEGRLCSPWQVEQAAAGGVVDPDEEIDEMVGLLGRKLAADSPYALLCVLVRLQAFHGPVRADVLRDALGIAAGKEKRRTGGLVEPFGAEHEFLRLAHPVDVEAVDTFMSDREPEILRGLDALREALPWTESAWNLWQLVAARRTIRMDPAKLPDRVLVEWPFELVERAVTHAPDTAWDLIECVFRRARDSWAVAELAFAVVYHWGALASDLRATSFLDELLRDRERYGTYGLLEAGLRLRPPPVEVWAATVSRIFKLARAGEDTRELALIFDGLLWRPPKVEHEQLDAVFDALFDAAERSAELRAAFAAAAAYHRHGAQHLIDRDRANPLDWISVVEQEPQIVAWLVAWHFVHQSRARALQTRRSFRSLHREGARYLNRGLYREPLQPEQDQAIAALVRRLAETDQRDWAVHLAMNVLTTHGSFQTAALSRTIRPRRAPEAGLLTAAIDYEPPPALQPALARYLRDDKNQQALLDYLGRGFEFDGTPIRPPRFHLADDPWAVRRRWRLDTSRLEALGLDASDPSGMLRWLRRGYEDATSAGANPADVDHVLTLFERGDTRPVEAVRQRMGDGRLSAGHLLFEAASELTPTLFDLE